MSDATLKQVHEIVGETVPEAVYKNALFSWRMYTKSEPRQPFIVCEYEAFQRLCTHFNLQINHVKATCRNTPYACFELLSLKEKVSQQKQLPESI